jgi:hypothetical protein
MRKWGIGGVVVLLFAGWLAGIGSWASPKVQASPTAVVSETLTAQDAINFRDGPSLHWRAMVMSQR